MASTLPYDFDPRKLCLAMKIGGVYRLDDIMLRHWQKLAFSLRLDEEQVRSVALDLADRVPDTLADIIRTVRADGLNHPILQRLGGVLQAKVARCRAILAAAPTAKTPALFSHGAFV